LQVFRDFFVKADRPRARPESPDFAKADYPIRLFEGVLFSRIFGIFEGVFKSLDHGGRG
jgi:hypothetical protein